MSLPLPFPELVALCQTSLLGKHLPNALYIHQSTLPYLDPQLIAYEQLAHTLDPKISQATVIKFHLNEPRVSYLLYPDFDDNPHPALQASIIVDLESLEITYRDYSSTDNPPILHRKETFVTPDYPHYQTFADLTYFEEKLGLLDNPRYIGTQQDWLARLKEQEITIENHRLVCIVDETIVHHLQIDRHKAAIMRKNLSRPVRLALEAELFTENSTFFDYGCGYGSDIQHLQERGFQSQGWDPYYYPDEKIISADVVNIGYVINVIEDITERREALQKAWELTKRVLIVSAQVLIHDNTRGIMAYGDGVLTARNTFQKYFDQEELKYYIDQVLQVDSIPIDLGIYAVFRDEQEAELFRASRFHSQRRTPGITRKIRLFEDYQELLQPLIEFMAERGRLPVKHELASEAEIKKEFRSYRKAFEVIKQATDEEEWERIVMQRQNDLRVYLALRHFDQRLSRHNLPLTIREDIKALLGPYDHACVLADMLYLNIRNLSHIREIAKESDLGFKTRRSILIHVTALDYLNPVLRLYEACAERTYGRLENTNVIELHWDKFVISYHYYSQFDEEEHPILDERMDIYLQNLEVSYHDFSRNPNPPILHYKNKLVLDSYPLFHKFTKLTRQEELLGLLDHPELISKAQEWEQRLEEHCTVIHHYKLSWTKSASPAKIKEIQKQIEFRKEARQQLELLALQEKENQENYFEEEELTED